MAGPACFGQTQPDDSKARQIESWREKYDKLEKIANDPALADASQDYVLSAFVEDSEDDKTVWILRIGMEAKELGIMGRIRHPSTKTIETLASSLGHGKSSDSYHNQLEDMVIEMALGRMGTTAKAELPTLRKFLSEDSEPIRRISGREPGLPEKPLSNLRSWGGSLSRIEKRESCLVRDQQSWDRLWQEHAGESKSPKVDFSKHSVVALFDGATDSMMHFYVEDFEQSASLAKMRIYTHYSDVHDAIYSYPFLMVEIPRLSVPLTIVRRTVMFRGDGEAVLARFDSNGQPDIVKDQGTGGKDPARQ
jgi:hypothetical protein